MSNLQENYPRTLKSFIQCCLVAFGCSFVEIIQIIHIAYPKQFVPRIGYPLSADLSLNLSVEVNIVIILGLIFFFSRKQDKKI